MKTKTKLSMTPAKTSQETLNIASAYESTNLFWFVSKFSPDDSPLQKTLPQQSPPPVKAWINGLTFGQVTVPPPIIVNYHECSLRYFLWMEMELALFLHPLFSLWDCSKSSRTSRKDTDNVGRRCGGWVGHLRHSCAIPELVNFMASDAIKVHHPSLICPAWSRASLPTLGWLLPESRWQRVQHLK